MCLDLIMTYSNLTCRCATTGVQTAFSVEVDVAISDTNDLINLTASHEAWIHDAFIQSTFTETVFFANITPTDHVHVSDYVDENDAAAIRQTFTEIVPFANL